MEICQLRIRIATFLKLGNRKIQSRRHKCTRFLDERYHFRNISGTSQKGLYIKKNNVILIQTFSIVPVGRNREILKKRIRINVFPIISTQHICCYGFLQTSRPAYTDKALFRFQNRVNIRNQSTFINIYFEIQGHLIIFIAGIQINTHLQKFPFRPSQQCLSISYETPEEVSI